jgi:phosphatidylglycerophosphate synthase
VIPLNVVPQARWLRGLRDVPLEAETLHVDPSAMVMIETGDPDRIVEEAARCKDAGELVAVLEGRWRVARSTFEATGRFPMASASEVPRAESWIFRSLVKRSEGFMSRHVERRISLALTRRLVTTGITPNAMTLVSLAIGLLGAPFFLSSWPAWQVAGALLFLAHSILDGCDGELARLKFLESPGGAMLDFWGDNLVHVAVFACMAVGWSLETEGLWPLGLGAVAVASTLGAASAMSRKTMRDEGVGPDMTLRERIADALAHRDFIYVVVFLAAWGRAWWFLPIASVGTPLFLLLLWAPFPRRSERGRIR